VTHGGWCQHFEEGETRVDTGRLHILTGAPGSGKTAVLDALDPGIHRAAEPAREILARRRAAGDTNRPRDWGAFISRLLQRSIEKHEVAKRLEGTVVFDRGIPDCVAYAVILKVDPGPAREAARAYRYHPDVLILPPWEDIYTTDHERTMSFADTLPFHDALVDAYARAGYRLVEVPRDVPERRAALVRELITRRS
jgi:predicted ATPase